MQKLNILIWHIHGAYLTALTQVEHNWYLPVNDQHSEGYIGRGKDSTLPAYVQEIPAAAVSELPLDLIIFQTPRNLLVDQYEILSTRQRQLPKIYLEHNTPEPHPTESIHPVADRTDIPLIHVTEFNRLMWNNGQARANVIEHSVAIDPAVTWTGELSEGIVVVNNIRHRGRTAGYDLVRQLQQQVPLAIVGMNSADIGGIGEIHYRYLHQEVARYRFFFSPMRYSSLPLAMIEAMMIGMPVVALATTEVASVIQNDVHGFISNNPDELAQRMLFLIQHPEEARRLGQNARQLAITRFGMERFKQDWQSVLQTAIRPS